MERRRCRLRDLRRAEIKLQELAQEVELYERQIEATERRLSGDLAFAEKSLQNLFHRMNLQKENLSDDPASKQKLLEITKEREQLEKMEFDAMSNLDQFKIIMKDFIERFRSEAIRRGTGRSRCAC